MTQPSFHGAALLIEDDPLLRRALARDLTQNGVDVTAVGTLGEATDALVGGRSFDVVVVDANLPDGDPLESFRLAVSVPLLVITGDAMGAAPRAAALGLPVLEKPFTPAALRAALADATRAQATARRAPEVEVEPFETFRARVAPEIIGTSGAIVRALTLVQRVATTRASVVIRGETGTGKEWMARAIHRASGRAGRLVAVNCAAIPETMVEAELFGHARGAFTGAVAARDGHLVASSKGTLFLDEIGELPLAAQAKLLRALQEREVTPIGSSSSVPVDLRVVAATHRDLRRMAESGAFRDDLLYRLDVIGISLAPLRQRPEDIPALAERFREVANERLGTSISGLTPAAVARLQGLPWPGNIRELQNLIERAAVLRQYGCIDADDVLPMTTELPPRRRSPQAVPVVAASGARSPGNAPGGAAAAASARATPPPAAPAKAGWVQLPLLPPEGINLRACVEEMERSLIEQALRRAGGNRNRAAALLGMKRTTLVERLRRLELAPPREPDDEPPRE